MGSGGSREQLPIERASHDFADGTSLSTTVVLAVARASGSHPADLPALTEAIDPDSLDNLFSTPGRQHRHCVVQFEYDGYGVRVSGDGDILIFAGGDDPWI